MRIAKRRRRAARARSSPAGAQHEHARVPREDGRPAEPRGEAALEVLQHASVSLHRIERSSGRGKRKEVVDVPMHDDVLGVDVRA